MKHYVIIDRRWGETDVIGVTDDKQLAEDYVSRLNSDGTDYGQIEEFEDMYKMDYSNPVYESTFRGKQFIKMEQIPIDAYFAKMIIRTGTFYTIRRENDSNKWSLIIFAPDPAVALKNAMELAETMKFEEETD